MMTRELVNTELSGSSALVLVPRSSMSLSGEQCGLSDAWCHHFIEAHMSVSVCTHTPHLTNTAAVADDVK